MSSSSHPNHRHSMSTDVKYLAFGVVAISRSSIHTRIIIVQYRDLSISLAQDTHILLAGQLIFSNDRRKRDQTGIFYTELPTRTSPKVCGTIKPKDAVDQIPQSSPQSIIEHKPTNQQPNISPTWLVSRVCFCPCP